MLALMVLAGAFEGTVLGILQWLALTRAFKTLPARDWISATIAIAATGWLVGMLPSTLMQPTAAGSNSVWEPPVPVFLAVAAVFGAVAGAAFGFAQWLVLRRHA